MGYSVAGAHSPVHRFVLTGEPRLRPLAIFLGIAMGSAVSLLAGLALTAAVFLFLPEYTERLQPERKPLLVALAWAISLAVISCTAFFGEIKGRPWRRSAQIVLVVLLSAMVWHYWPTEN